VLAVSSVTAAGVNCNNQTGDAAKIQVAVNGGGSFALNGSCALGNAIITVNNPVTITGSAQLSSTSANAFVVSSDNVSISGLTFNGAGLWLNKTPTQTGFVFTNNTIQNTHGANAISADGILIKGNISGNIFTGIAPDGFANATFASLGFGACYTQGGCDAPGVGIQIWAGIDQTIIEHNHFDLIANDGMHIGWNAIAADSQYFLTKNNSISYNSFSRVHRIGIEAQAIWAWPYCGFGGREQCDAGHDLSTNTKIAGNYFHDAFLSYVDTYAYSLALAGPGNYINNAGLANVDSGALGYGIEDMGQNVLTQGNVIASNYLPSSNPHGWGADIIYGAQRAGTTFTTQNNILCGDQSTTKNFGREPFSSGSALNQYNFIANTCPNAGALTASNIALAFVAPDQSPTTGIWNMTVKSALPIKYVQFLIDGSQTPLVTQEIQDVSTTFATDRNWLYHANVDATTLATGAHTITATATDVTGTIKSITQSLTGGGPITTPPAPVFQATPNPLAFGSQLKGTPSSKQMVTVNNTGNEPLVVSEISVGGANAADFQGMNNCSAPLTANITCTVTAIFTPTTSGAESAFLSFSDNTADSPHRVALSGTGAAGGGGTPLTPGTYNVKDPNTGNTMDLGWALNPQWGNNGPYVYLYTYNNGSSQQIAYTSSGQLQSAQNPGEYFYNDGGALALRTTGDTFSIAASGNGYTIQDQSAGGLYVNSASAIDPPNKLSLSSTPTVWMFAKVSTGGGSLSPGKAYTFQDGFGNTMDLGWALNPEWGFPTYVYLFSYNDNPSQQLMLTSSGQLQSVANSSEYLSNSGGFLSLGPTRDIFSISASGNGYTIYDQTVGLYVNTPGAIDPPNKLVLSSTPTVWMAKPK
jgi:hypothetical protein